MTRILNRILDFFELHLATAVFALLLFSITVEVFMRYVLNEPSPEFFELTIYSYVWTIYLGASLAKRYNQHIRFDIINRKLPLKVRLFIDVFFDSLVLVIFGLVLIPSIDYTIWNYRIMASALQIPWTYLLACYPLFVLLVMIHCVRSIYRNGRAVLGLAPPPEPEVMPWQ